MGNGFCFCFRETEIVERKWPIHPTASIEFIYWQLKSQYLVKYYLYFPSSWKVILLVLALKSPRSSKPSTPRPKQETLHITGLKNTEVTVPPGWHPAIAQEETADKPDIKTSKWWWNSYLLHQVLYAAELASHLSTSLAFFLLSHHGHVTYILQPKIPSPTPYLTFNYKTNRFLMENFVLRVPLTLRIRLGSIYT